MSLTIELTELDDFEEEVLQALIKRGAKLTYMGKSADEIAARTMRYAELLANEDCKYHVSIMEYAVASKKVYVKARLMMMTSYDKAPMNYYLVMTPDLQIADYRLDHTIDRPSQAEFPGSPAERFSKMWLADIDAEEAKAPTINFGSHITRS